ncbi:MAG: hypothetical protein ACFFBP_04250 [Promethearchaeota archaeon]
MSSNPIILTSTYHDPEFRLKQELKSALPKIKLLFKKRIVCLTPAMNEESTAFLKEEGFIVRTCQTDRRIDTYKLAYQTAIENIKNSVMERIMYVDFDRLIHWINLYPDELQKTINNIDIDNLHVGRTSRAFNTHPATQKETEIIVNEFGSKILGFNETKDIISVCHVITKELAEKILSLRNKTNSGFYCTWPILVWSWADSNKYIEVEGLEWETPDRYKNDIVNKGYKKWLENYLNPSEWRIRVDLLHDCLLELLNLTNIKLNM